MNFKIILIGCMSIGIGIGIVALIILTSGLLYSIDKGQRYEVKITHQSVEAGYTTCYFQINNDTKHSDAPACAIHSIGDKVKVFDTLVGWGMDK